MEFHDAANIFPLDEENIPDLAADIKKNGLHFPIETLDGKIIDGRRRWTACQKAKVVPQFKAITTADPIDYVLSINLHRRHLTPSQRAMVGARAREAYDKAAKERQKEAGKAHGRGKEKVPEKLPEPIGGDARDFVGRTVNVSGKTIDHATKVLETAIPEVIEAVDQGRMSVNTARILCTEDEETQREEATKPKRNRTYQSVSKKHEAEEQDEEPEEEKPSGKQVGVGVIRANEAINSLTRIPKNDSLRQRGLQLVKDWIRNNS